jgi:nitric oxide dioxygenase
MPMTSEQVKAIQDSFAKVAPISEQAAGIFYGRLFEIAPAVKPLFRGDMKEQKKRLMEMLTVVINGLDNLEAVLPEVSALAKRHVEYGVKVTDYAPVGEALLWTLERGLGEHWTPDVAAAHREVLSCCTLQTQRVHSNGPWCWEAARGGGRCLS